VALRSDGRRIRSVLVPMGESYRVLPSHPEA
jgi:hypothetical protein